MANIPEGWEVVSDSWPQIPDGWEVVGPAPISTVPSHATARPGVMQSSRTPAAPVEPAPPAEDTLNQDYLAGFGGSLYGAGIGAAQLGVEGLKVLTPKSLEGPLDRASVKLQTEEAERRRVMDELKAKYGAKGITNPISRADFLGEVYPYAVAGAVSAGRAVASQLPVSYLKTAGQGAMIGGTAGAAAPLVEGESRGLATGVGALGGAVLTPAVRLGAELTQVAGKKAGEGVMSWVERRALRKADPEVGNLLDGPGKIIENNLRKIAPRTSADIKTPAALAREIKNDNAAVQTVAKMRDQISFTRNGREVTGKTPETLGEALEATTQSIGKTAGWIDQISENAGLQGVRIPVNEVAGELSKVSVKSGYLPNQEALAKKWLAQLEPLSQEGGMSVPASIRLMTNLNNDIKSIFTGKNVSGDSPELLGMIAGKLRESLNKTLNATEGGAQFGEFRATLGQLMNLEKRLLKTAEKEANKNAKASMSIFDIIAAEQLIRSAARGSATGLIEAPASWLTGKAMKILNSPDRAVRQVFRTADYMSKNSRMAAPVIPPATPPTTYFDPTIGARVPIKPGGGGLTPTGTSAGLPSQPSVYFDKTVGAWLPVKPGGGGLTPTGTSTGGAPTTYFDPTIGARTSVKP